MFCEKYYKKLLNYAKKDQIWADPNCPYRGSLCGKTAILYDTLGLSCLNYLSLRKHHLRSFLVNTELLFPCNCSNIGTKQTKLY